MTAGAHQDRQETPAEALARLQAEVTAAQQQLMQREAEHQRALAEQRIWLEREILERKQAEMALQEAEQRLETALAGSPITLFTQDGGLRYTWMYNPVADWPMNRVIGQRDEDLFGPEQGARLREIKAKVLQSGEARRETVSLRIDGAERWFSLHINPLRDQNGRTVGVICASVDITEIKQLERRVADSEARYRAIIEALDGMIYICSEDYTIEFMNAKHAAQRGEHAVGSKCYQVLHGLDGPCPWCQNERVMRGEKVEWEVQSPLDGRWYHVVNTPIRRADGSRAKMAFILDINDRKTAEQQRDEMAQVIQKTQHLESMARLTGNIAHHFNNQLTVILGNAELARDELPPAHPLDLYLKEICAAAERAAKVSGELLKCSGHAITEMAPADLNAFIESMRAMLEVLAAPRIRLEIRTAAELPLALMDAGLIRQLALNLVTNSIEAIGERPGVIALETGARELSPADVDRLRPHGPPRSGRYVFLRVTDTGGGIPDDIMPRLFDPFASTKGLGRGLGLSVALGIAEAHGGGVEIASTPGEGVAATLYLPAHLAGEEPAP